MSRNNASTLPSWELRLAKILGVSPEALLAARGGGMETSSSMPSPSLPSVSAPSSPAPSFPPPLVLYDVTRVTDRQIVNG